jgi:fluoride exporter
VSLLGWVGFVAAAAIGAPVRYVVDGYVQERFDGSLPLGTFVVNISGSFLLGLVAGLALHHGLGGGAKTVLGTGFLGAYTTFSTFTFETIRLVEDGSMTEALGTGAASLAVGCVAAAVGLWLAAVL